MRWVAAWLLSVSTAFAGPTGGPATFAPGGFISTNTTTVRLFNDRGADRINVRDFGARGNLKNYNDGVIASGSSSFSSASASFTQADVGKTFQMDGVGAGGVTGPPLVTTISSVQGTHNITLSSTASQASGQYYLALITQPIVTSGTSGSYVKGDTLTITGGTYSVQAVAVVQTTQVRSVTVNAAGTGGTTGSCTLTGTTGTGAKFTASATIAAGSISAINSITFGGSYTVNPTSLSAEPVTSNCNLSGATVTVAMGVYGLGVNVKGAYTVKPVGNVATGAGGTSGATGAVLSPGWGQTGFYSYASDDTSAFTAAINKLTAIWATGTPAFLYVPQGFYYINGATLPTLTNVGGGILGESPYATNIVIGASYSGTLFGFSSGFQPNQIFNGPTYQVAQNQLGQTIKNINVYGDLFAGQQQNAVVFYDLGWFQNVEDLNVFSVNGYCLNVGNTLNQPYGGTQESRYNKIRCWNSGVYTASVEFNSAGSPGGGNGEVWISQLDIYAPRNTGFWYHGTSPSGFNAERIRVEGQETNPNNVTADLVEIGDTTTVSGNPLNGLYLDQLDLIDPYVGGAALHITASGGGYIPYYVVVKNGYIGGGLPFGDGLKIDYLRTSTVDFISIGTYGTNISAPSSNQVVIRGSLVQSAELVQPVTSFPYFANNYSSTLEVQNGTGSAGTIYLPQCTTGISGTRITVTDYNGNANTLNITVQPLSGNINGAASYAINTARGSIVSQCDYNGGGWFIVSKF